jgi:hypothetical protein
MTAIFREGKVYIEVPPPPEAPWRLKPDGRGGWRRVDQAQTFLLATVALGPPPQSGAPPLSHFPPRTSPRLRTPRPRSFSGRDGGDDSGDDGGGDDDGSGSDGPPPSGQAPSTNGGRP